MVGLKRTGIPNTIPKGSKHPNYDVNHNKDLQHRSHTCICFICLHIYIYIYVYIYTHIHTYSIPALWTLGDRSVSIPSRRAAGHLFKYGRPSLCDDAFERSLAPVTGC